jgi:coproporphyrinogen III oxidase-like Fe-S oxidoreductase
MSDLARATKLGIPGLTLYGTVYLPQFQEHCEKGGYQVSGPAERFAMYEMAYHHLTSTGYPQPHFGANAFLRGALNPHRRNVELGLPMLGLGTWAYSSTGPFAYHNLYPSAEWARQISSGKLPIRQLVPVPESERARKYVVEALLLAYLNLGHFRARFGRELHEEFPHELAVLDREGLVKIEDGELRLTRRGGRHLREIRYLFASESVVDAIETGAAASL